MKAELRLPAPADARFNIPVKIFPVKTTEIYRDESMPIEVVTDFVASAKSKDSEEINAEFEASNYSQLTRFHGKSVIDRKSESTMLLDDNYGNPMGSVSWKGNVVSSIWEGVEPLSLERSGLSSAGYRVHGLHDSLDLNDVLSSSAFLRENGLPTEMILGVSLLEEVIDKSGQRISMPEWKVKTIRDQHLPTAKEFIEKSDFYIVQRCMPIGLRIRDFKIINSSWHKSLEPVFNWINKVSQVKGYAVIPGTEPVNFSANDENILRYLFSWLPSQMGTYLGRLHNLRVTHGYAHSQNWSAAGTLVDLDSLKGKNINGIEPTSKDYINDLHKTSQAGSEIVEYFMSRFGIVTNLNKVPQTYDSIANNFAQSYIKEREKDSKIPSEGSFEQLKINYAAQTILGYR